MRTKGEQREMWIQQEMRGCTHFTGIQHKCCDAGVNYRNLASGEELGWARRIPCMGGIAEGMVACEKIEHYTREQAEQVINDRECGFENTIKAMQKAKEDARAKGFKIGAGGRSELPCPICKAGMLMYSVAASNGHMHAKCSTPDCVSWME